MKLPSLKLAVPGGEKEVLLHTCCAPCSSAIVECMLKQGIEPVIFYSNSNIYPREEYEHRRDECARYAASLGIRMVEDEYSHEDWLHAVQGLENEPERGSRCLACFRWRLARAARYAEGHDLKVLTTTLASSRWKRLDQINEAGAWAASQFDGVEFWDRNWRKGGLQQRRNELLKENQFYNQLYCGCEYSLEAMKAMGKL